MDIFRNHFGSRTVAVHRSRPIQDISSTGASQPGGVCRCVQHLQQHRCFSAWQRVDDLYKRIAHMAALQSTAATATLNIGTFNCGINQGMLTGKNCGKYLKLLASVTAEAVETSLLDVFVGCEVGGHRQGLPGAGIAYADVMAEPFGSDVDCQALQNYTAVWNFNDSDRVIPKLKRIASEVKTLNCSGMLDPPVSYTHLTLPTMRTV